MGDRNLTRAEGIAVAKLSGIAMRHGSGQGEGDPVAQLHAVSTDPRLLGVAAGAYTTPGADPHQRRAADLLRQAGADMQVAAEQAKVVAYRQSLPTSKDQPR